MSFADELLRRHERRAAASADNLPAAPAGKLTIVTCMDARIDVYQLLGLELGEAHVLRNAGGVITEDTIRSLTLSQRLLGTEEVVLIHHTDCGLTTFRDDALTEEIEAETGQRPPFAFGAFSDTETSVRESARRILESPFVRNTDVIRGFIYDVHSGRLREVPLPR